MKTLEQMLACATRELSMRERVYPQWVAKGKMSEAKAQHEIDCMSAICAKLERLKILNEAHDDMFDKKTDD